MRNRRTLFSKKRTLSSEAWEKMQADARIAHSILADDDFVFLRTFLTQRQSSILETFAKESIQDATTQETFAQGVIRTIFHPAKKEYSHLAGQYTLITEIFSLLQMMIDQANDMKKQQDLGLVVLDQPQED